VTIAEFGVTMRFAQRVSVAGGDVVIVGVVPSASTRSSWLRRPAIFIRKASQ